MALDRVDRLNEEFEVEIDYQPFFLHPEIPPGGVPVTALYGSNQSYFNAVHANFTKLAAQAGLPVGEINIIAHTKLPLMVAEVAKEQGRHEDFHRAIFHAYWAEGKNVGEWEILQPLIEGAKMELSTDTMVARFQELERQVDDSFLKARKRGVTGIPTFFIGDEPLVGAHPYETIRQAVLRQLSHDATG